MVLTRVDLDAEDLLDGDLDLGLVRARVDDEGVLALVEQAVLFSETTGRDQDVAGVLGQWQLTWRPPRGLAAALARRPATNASSAPWVKTTSSEHEHVVGVELVGDEHVHARRGCARDFQRDLVAALEHDEHVLALGQAGEQRGGGLGRRRVARRPASRRRACGRRGPGPRGHRAGRRPSSSWGCAARSHAACGPWTTPPPANCGARVEP